MTHLASDITDALETLITSALPDEQEAKDIVNDVGNALDDLDERYAVCFDWVDDEPDDEIAVVRTPVELELDATTYLKGAYIESRGLTRRKTEKELIDEANRPKSAATTAEFHPDTNDSAYLHDLIRRLAHVPQDRHYEVYDADFSRLSEIAARTAIPAGIADGGSTFETEVRWAIDACQRGDNELAKSRLHRILKGERL